LGVSSHTPVPSSARGPAQRIECLEKELGGLESKPGPFPPGAVARFELPVTVKRQPRRTGKDQASFTSFLRLDYVGPRQPTRKSGGERKDLGLGLSLEKGRFHLPTPRPAARVVDQRAGGGHHAGSGPMLRTL